MSLRRQILVMGLGWTLAPGVQAEEATPEVSQWKPQRANWSASRSLGVASIQATAQNGSHQAKSSAGIALKSHAGRWVTDSTRINMGVSMGITEPERTQILWDVGTNTVQWTNQAYRDVYEWSQTDDDYAFFRMTGSMVAYSLLLVPYAFSGLCYMGGPVAAISFTQLDGTASHHLNGRGHGPYVEGGMGLIIDWLPETNIVGSGLGPVVGAGIEWGPVLVGAKVLWAPASLHHSEEETDWSLTTATITLGVGG